MTKECGLFGVTVKAILVKNNKFLFMKRSAYRNSPYQWDLPGGCLAPKEDPSKGLIREVLEETGYTVKIIKILAVEFYKNYETIFITYLVKPTKGKLKLSEEHIESEWCPLNKKLEVKELLKKGKEYIKKKNIT